MQQGAAILAKEAKFFVSSDKRQQLTSLANGLKDNKLRGGRLRTRRVTHILYE